MVNPGKYVLRLDIRIGEGANPKFVRSNEVTSNIGFLHRRQVRLESFQDRARGWLWKKSSSHCKLHEARRSSPTAFPVFDIKNLLVAPIMSAAAFRRSISTLPGEVVNLTSAAQISLPKSSTRFSSYWSLVRNQYASKRIPDDAAAPKTCSIANPSQLRPTHG